jgi:hypothetical protein
MTLNMIGLSTITGSINTILGKASSLAISTFLSCGGIHFFLWGLCLVHDLFLTPHAIRPCKGHGSNECATKENYTSERT